MFKSLLFLVSGSIIHISGAFQSIYKIRIGSISIRCSYIGSSLCLILALSKEYIINTSLYLTNSMYIYILYSIGGLLTCVYSMIFYIYVFHLYIYGILSVYYHYVSVIFIWYGMSCIFMDQSLDGCFNDIYIIGDRIGIYSNGLYGCIGFISIYYIIWSLLGWIYGYIWIRWIFKRRSWNINNIINLDDLTSYKWLLDSRSSYIWYRIYNILIRLSIYIFMPFIQILEWFIGIDGGSIYVLVYYHFSTIIIGIIIYLWMVILLILYLHYLHY